jgi:hypothetical protein
MQRSSNAVISLRGRTPIEEVTGETPDITEYLDFRFYDHVWYWENAGLGERQLGRWLGMSHRVGTQMCYFIIKQNGQVISRTSVQPITTLELQTDEVKTLCNDTDTGIHERLNDDNHQLLHAARDQPTDWRGFDLTADDDFINEFHNVVDHQDIPEADDDDETYVSDIGNANYINVEIALPVDINSEPQVARVIKRRTDDNGKPLGTPHSNPLLDTRQYDVTDH